MSLDDRWMHMALGLAARGLGHVWPNPAVGCVIVRDGHLVGTGWTQPGGRPHAETVALAQAGPDAKGATAYVTLEPCAHTGQTPPCAKALIDSGISRVVVATSDPDPRVDGGGIAMLRAAGVQVTTDTLAPQARALNEGFLRRVTQSRPMVTLKLATSLDGRIATATGHSQWITAPLARRHVHAQRARHDAVMIGAGTARSDDPSLTVRDLGVAHQPVRVILSRALDLPLDSVLTRSAHDTPVWICHGPAAPAEMRAAFAGCGVTLIACRTTPTGQIDPADALHQLATKGLTRVYCEGGGALAASLLQADLVDHLHHYGAGLAIGSEGTAALGPLGLNTLTHAPSMALRDSQIIGPDTFTAWQRAMPDF